MSSKSIKLKLKYRKLKISDYYQFKELFYSCFNKKISFEFFKWRYFSDNYSFCYGVFDETRLIANVGLFSVKLNNTNYERVFSRHSSMVSKNYRGLGIFSSLLNKVKKIIQKKSRLIVMWPNKNNFANFGINKENIIIKKYYLYKFNSNSNYRNLRKFLNITELVNLKHLIEFKSSLF